MVVTVTTAMPRAPQLLEPGRERPDGREQRRPVRKSRSAPSSAPGGLGDLLRRAQLAPSGGGKPQRERRPLEPLDVAAEQDGPAAPQTRTVSNAARAAKERLVVGVEDRRGRVDEPAPPTAAARSAVMRAPGCRPRRAAGCALTHDSSISASGSESQTIPPPTQRWTRPSATASVRIVSASSKSPSGRSDAERAHRRAAPDRLERGDQVERRDLRRAR